MKSFTITKTEILPGSEALIEGELSAEAVNKERAKTLRSFQSRITLDGFRKGHVPEKILIEKVGELSIYEESASLAFEHIYEEILKESGIQAVGNPRVSITKISPGNPVGFKIETAVMPKIKLPDYKKEIKEISSNSNEEDVVVEDKDVEQALDDMRRSMAHHEKHHKEGSVGTASPHDDHSGKDIPEAELPALNDEFAKSVGNFDSLDVLKNKIREGIANEKRMRAKEKKRLSIIDMIIQKSDISLPRVLVESELNKLISEFRTNLERMGIGYNEYLTHIKKEEEDLRKEWQGEAEKRARIHLVLKQIAADEKLEADETLVQKETDSILSQYKDVERVNVESYVRNIFQNEKVWQFLEDLGSRS